MFPSFCGPMGMAGWLLMLLVWAGLVALTVWGIARLFPDHPHGSDRAPDAGDAGVPEAAGAAQADFIESSGKPTRLHHGQGAA